MENRAAPPSVSKPYVPPEGVNVKAIGRTSGVTSVTPSTALTVIVPLAVTECLCCRFLHRLAWCHLLR